VSMPGSVLQNILGGVLWSLQGVYLGASSKPTWEGNSCSLGVCHQKQVGAYSQVAESVQSRAIRSP
jgi:hypothetical protein